MTRRGFDPAAFRWAGVEEKPYKESGGWEGVARFALAPQGLAILGERLAKLALGEKSVRGGLLGGRGRT